MAKVTEQHREAARKAISRSMNDPAGSHAERLEINVAQAIADSAPPEREAGREDVIAKAKAWAKAINMRETENEPGESEIAGNGSLVRSRSFVSRVRDYEDHP
jgi:hypothetical protein